MDLSHVSTRELLETLARRGDRAKANGEPDGDHLKTDAEHLLRCLPSDLLNYPFRLRDVS